MWQIISGSLLLSLVHAAIPNHWLPIVAIGKSERWTMRETLNATVLIGAAHIASTIIIGVLIGLAGFRLSSNHAELAHWIAPVVLAVLGVIFIASDFIGKGHRHHNHFDETGGAASAPLSGRWLWQCFSRPASSLRSISFPPERSAGLAY